MNSVAARPVLKVALPVPLPGLFDYLVPEGLPGPVPGCRVLVRFGARKLVGVAVASSAHSELPPERLQPVTGVLDEGQPALTPELLRLLAWCAGYYKHPRGEVIFNALPPALRSARGALPPPPVRLALTAAGRERVAAPPGRATAQYAVLRELASGALRPEALRRVIPGSGSALRAVIGKGWVREQPGGAVEPNCLEGPPLTGEQHATMQAIREGRQGFQCHLVDGITGSGKTEIYLRLVQEVIEAGRQALVLVPEIGLTPQLLRRFRDRLGVEPALSHSGLAAGERLRTWAGALRGEFPLIMGTRSALFLPLARPGIVIMDESHDPSFKQQEGFRFAARDVAVKRAADLDIPIVLGTATPSLETLNNARAGRYAWHKLRRRATGAPPPSWRVLDLRQQPVTGGLSAAALEAIGEAIGRREQVVVFLNRRGYAPVLLCHECGWHAECPNCDANMTWHQAGRSLVCHHCDCRQPVPRMCPDCRADALQGAGEGTEQLEDFLGRRFAGTRLLRVDRDRVRRRGDLEAMIEEVREGEPCILVGTQMLAKGHHFPRVTLVVVVNLDQALYSADFRAVERMGQLLVQVAGRAGRDRHPGTVVLQTHHPDHPALETLLRSGYEVFALEQLAERRLAGLPPFAYQAVLRADAPQKQAVTVFLERAMAAWPGPAGEAFGPFPAMLERRAGRVRWYVLVQASRRGRLQASLDAWLEMVRGMREARRVRWSIDVDPQEF